MAQETRIAPAAPRRRLLRALAAGAALGAVPRAAAAQGAAEWPNRPLRLIVPYLPGGTTDIVARQYAEHLRASLGQPVVVDNRAGAATNIGTEAVVRSPADGHTLLFGSTLLAINPTFGPALPGIDPVTALDPVGMLCRIPFLVAANPRSGLRGAGEMIARARERPGRLTIGSAQLDFQVALLNHRSGISLEHVGYRGGAAAMADAIAGQIDMVYALVPVLLPAVRGGQLLGVGVTAQERSPVLPDVPTFRETGKSTAVTESWYGIFAPAGTPRAVVNRLSAATQAFARDQEVVARFTSLGIEPAGSTPEELGTALRDLTADYRRVVQELRGGTDPAR